MGFKGNLRENLSKLSVLWGKMRTKLILEIEIKPQANKTQAIPTPLSRGIVIIIVMTKSRLR